MKKNIGKCAKIHENVVKNGKNLFHKIVPTKKYSRNLICRTNGMSSNCLAVEQWFPLPNRKTSFNFYLFGVTDSTESAIELVNLQNFVLSVIKSTQNTECDIEYFYENYIEITDFVQSSAKEDELIIQKSRVRGCQSP